MICRNYPGICPDLGVKRGFTTKVVSTTKFVGVAGSLFQLLQSLAQRLLGYPQHPGGNGLVAAAALKGLFHKLLGGLFNGRQLIREDCGRTFGGLFGGGNRCCGPVATQMGFKGFQGKNPGFMLADRIENH